MKAEGKTVRHLNAQLVGVELYFENLKKGKEFYAERLGLGLVEEEKNHHAKFGTAGGFICLEKKGVESYPSKDKAVIFIEVPDLRAAVERIGKEHIIKYEFTHSPPWAVTHDPEGHNVLLLQASHSLSQQYIYPMKGGQL